MKVIKGYKLYTNADLFRIVNNELKNNRLLPGILDYGNAPWREVEIPNTEWDTIGIVRFGGSEGIYLDLYAEGMFDGERKNISLGTYKTLETSKDAFKVMTNLNAEFVFAMRDFVSLNSRDFNWEGHTIRLVRNGEEVRYGITTDASDKKDVYKSALRYLHECTNHDHAVVIIDNRTKERNHLTEDELRKEIGDGNTLEVYGSHG